MSLESFQQSVSCRWSIFQDETPTLLKECLMFLWRSVHLLSPRIILRSVWARTCRGNKNSPGRIQQVQTAQTPDGDWPDCRCSAGRHDSYESVCSVLLTSDINHLSLSESLLINVFTVTLFILNVVLKHSWCFYGVSHQLYVLFLFLFLLPLIKHYSVFKCLLVLFTWFMLLRLSCCGNYQSANSWIFQSDCSSSVMFSFICSWRNKPSSVRKLLLLL